MSETFSSHSNEQILPHFPVDSSKKELGQFKEELLETTPEEQEAWWEDVSLNSSVESYEDPPTINREEHRATLAAYEETWKDIFENMKETWNEIFEQLKTGNKKVSLQNIMKAKKVLDSWVWTISSDVKNALDDYITFLNKTEAYRSYRRHETAKPWADKDIFRTRLAPLITIEEWMKFRYKTLHILNIIIKSKILDRQREKKLEMKFNVTWFKRKNSVPVLQAAYKSWDLTAELFWQNLEYFYSVAGSLGFFNEYQDRIDSIDEISLLSFVSDWMKEQKETNRRISSIGEVKIIEEIIESGDLNAVIATAIGKRPTEIVSAELLFGASLRWSIPNVMNSDTRKNSYVVRVLTWTKPIYITIDLEATHREKELWIIVSWVLDGEKWQPSWISIKAWGKLLKWLNFTWSDKILIYAWLWTWTGPQVGNYPAQFWASPDEKKGKKVLNIGWFDITVRYQF